MSVGGPGKIHIGTSGWSYKHWKSIFYPGDLPTRSYLSFYGTHFNTTEINASFYRMPEPITLQSWVSATPPGFVFCPKMSRFVTHMKKLKDPAHSVHKFFDAFASIRTRLGPVLIQLPAALVYHQEKADLFFGTLHRMYKEYEFALEIRHASWLETRAIDLLLKYKVALVIAESGHRWPYAEILTAKHIYVRFHGPDGYYASCYDNQTLAAFAVKFRNWQANGHTVWAFFNNDINGYALENARTMIAMCQSTERKVNA